MKIDWSQTARQRMRDIRTYYKTKSAKASTEILIDIKTAVESLRKFPQMGSIEPLLSDLPISFRYLVVRGNYKIVYYIDDVNEKVNIVTIWDCRQSEKKMKSEVEK